HKVADGRQAERGVIVTQVLGLSIASEKVDGPRGPSKDAGPRPLDCIGRRVRASQSCQLFEDPDMQLDPALYCLEIRPDLRLVPQALDLARHGLVDMLLEGEHVGDIAVDGVWCTAHCTSGKVDR